jgi:hypothetical protein
MPSFLIEVLGFNLGSAGVLCVFPYLTMFASTMGLSVFFDYAQKKRNWSVNTVRRTAMFVAFVVSSLLLVLCGHLENKAAAYFFMIVTQVKAYLQLL